MSTLYPELMKDTYGREYEGFSGDTLVRTAQYLVPIKNLKVGDKVVAFDFKKKKACLVTITAISKKTCYKTMNVEIIDDDGKVCPLQAGTLQSFFSITDNACLKSKDCGNAPLVGLGKKLSFKRNGMVIGLTPLYGIKVDKHHNFFVTEHQLLTHNFIGLALASALSTYEIATWVIAAAAGTTAIATKVILSTSAALAVTTDDGNINTSSPKKNGKNESGKKSENDNSKKSSSGGPRPPKKDDNKTPVFSTKRSYDNESKKPASSNHTPPLRHGEFSKLKNGQGFRDSKGRIWKIDQKHKNSPSEHWDIIDSKGNKVMEVDYNGKELWPNGPKNKGK